MSELSERAAEIRQRWENKQENPSSVLNEEDALNMGIIQPEDNDTSSPTQPQQPSNNQETNYEYMDTGEDERVYEKLGAWDTTKDVAKSVGVEALHFIQPRRWETQYESRTHFGENMKYGYRYTVGTIAFLASFFWGGGEVATAGALVKGASMLPKATAIGGGMVKLGQGLQKLSGLTKGASYVTKGLKAARAGKSAKTAIMLEHLKDGAFGGSLAAGVADFTLYRPEENEGHIMDMFGETDNPVISFLQTKETDSAFDARLKNVVDGFIVGIPFGGAIGATTATIAMQPAVRRWFKGIHKAAQAKTAEKAAEGLTEAAGAKIPIDNIAKTMDMVTEVDKIIDEAGQTGEEVSQMIADRFPTTKIDEAQAMAKLREAGEEIFPYEDGTWSITVKKYDDAYKVTPEQYQYQLKYQDPDGNLGIRHMNNAVEDTWKQRGLVDGEGLYSAKASERNSTTKAVVDYYTNKWELNNKPVKTNQSAIDKKKLQIKKIEDKITMLEGGNKEVSDPLDNLKEQLRIAQEDLNKLENPQPKAKNNKITVKYGDWSNIPDGKTTQYKNGNILIQINKNSPDIYATLRGELEHARDYIKGEVPAKADVAGSGEHFARYVGDNEAEVAPQYAYKKSVGRAKAASQNVMNDGQTLPNELKYNQGDINGQQSKQLRQETSGYGGNGTGYSANDEGIRLFRRRSEDGTSFRVLDPSPEFKSELEQLGYPINSYKELAVGDEEQTASFITAFRASNEANGKLAAQVYEYTPEEYKQMRLHIAENGKSGFAIKEDGDIVSVFSSEKHGSYAAMKLAIENGGYKLDCFDTFLPRYYKKFGFKEVRREKWNEKYKPKNWDKEFFKQYNNGEPDVIYMELDRTPKTPKQPIQETIPEPKPQVESQQLKLDFSQVTPENIGASIAKGDIDLTDVNNIDNIVNHIMNNDVEISGTKFKDVLEDADSYYNTVMKDDPMKAAAYIAAQSPEELDRIARQQLATIKLISVLRDVQANANPRENLRILSAVKQLDKYIEGVGSGFGRGLRYQALTKKALDMFGSEKYSDLAIQGLNDLADILDTQSLNFTRNQSLKDFKAELIKAMKQKDYYNEIMGDRQLFSKLNEVIEAKYNALKNGKQVDSSKMIMEILNRDEAETCGWYAKLADTTKGFVDTIKHWGNQAPSYVINNVLGVASAFKNISSGAIQSNLYPTYKILGGLLTGNGEITREGIDQWLGTFVNFGEAMRLAKQAFIKGDGLLTNTKEMMEGTLQDGFHKWATSFKEIGEDGFGITLQNLHSVIPRFMMASDEFMSQLNYRNIVRSKALSQARREADLIGGDVAQLADEIFRKTGFNEDGRPLDFQAYVEAKDMLFQIPLNRKIYNYATGMTEDTGIDRSLISGIGSWIQQGTQQFVPLRIFMPFVKTPANIADQALKSNPLYAVLNANTRKQFFSTDPEIRAKAFGKMATMLTLGGGFTLAAAQGYITGSEPLDKKEKTALYKTGWRPYSVKVGDKWIPYMGMITPLDSYMAFCADNVALVGRNLSPEQQMGMGEMAGQILGNIMNEYIDQAGFRTNTEKMMDIFNPSTDVKVREKLAANFFSGFLPMSGNVNAVRSTVKTIKGETAQTKPEGFYNNLVKNYTDVFTTPQDYKRDVFGNRVDQYGLLIAKATDDKFMQPEYAEMARMAEKGYTPSNISHLLKKTGVPLEEFKSVETGRSAYDAMYDELTELRIGGKSLQEAVAAVISSPRYQTMNDGINEDGKDWRAVPYKTKKKLLDDVFQRYYTQAKNKVIYKRGKEFVDKNGMTMRERQQSIRLQMLNERNIENLNMNLNNYNSRF